jgi:O-antigen ligase
MEHPPGKLAKWRDPFAYRALILFTFLYFSRPEDFFHPLAIIPLGKITGGLAFLALLSELSKRRGMKLPLAVKFLLLLFAQMILTIPFAVWRGGAFKMVFSSFSKGVMVAVLVSMLVTTLPQLRKLMFVQAVCVSLMTLASIAIHHTDGVGRLSGVSGGVFENPNDLAINIGINFPFAFAFFLRARGPRKAFWGGAMLVMLYGVMLTYSRSGFLALALASLISLWEFGIKGRRFYLIFAAFLLLIGAVAFAPENYSERLQSIFMGRISGSGDRGSAEARALLLKDSIQQMLEHPLFGVGPGNFQVVNGVWKVAHNTYSEMGAEAGVPALILFLLVLGAAYRSLRNAQKSPYCAHDREFQIISGGVKAAFGAYLIGAFFSDTAYNLFPYYLIAYACALRQIAELQPGKPDKQANRKIWAQRSLAPVSSSPRMGARM